MVTISSAENALKNLYLGVVADQLNTGINPLFAKIKQTTSDVWGKNIVKLVPYGINGGVGAGTETGDLPIASGNNYAQFTLTSTIFTSINGRSTATISRLPPTGLTPVTARRNWTCLSAWTAPKGS